MSTACQSWDGMTAIILPDVIRRIPSGIHYACPRMKGKLIRKSLKTDLHSVAKLWLADFDKQQRQCSKPPDAAARQPRGALRASALGRSSKVR